jgi:hypothetical protein
MGVLPMWISKNFPVVSLEKGSKLYRLRRWCGWGLSLPILLVGCRLMNDPAATVGKSPLRPIRSSPDSVAVEIFWARYPCSDGEISNASWQEIDETPIPVDVRRRLATNGFRVGVVGSFLPDPLARALQLDGESGTRDPPADNLLLNQVDPSVEPMVRRRRLQLKAGCRAEIQASGLIREVPLLLAIDGELGGCTYADAQAVFAIDVTPQPDQSVELRLVPELHHGPQKLRYMGGEDGVLRQEAKRDRKVFKELEMTISLSPGEMLVMMGRPDAEGKIGTYFHSVDGATAHQQKLIAIRLAQVPQSQSFSGSPFVRE